ncbi:MAG: cell division ATP-binding protein FtsE [Lachnospiraceae bacterium]|nr:cell division ATP-binding protein FtsE [Lachnospiraceae bacterium]
MDFDITREIKAIELEPPVILFQDVSKDYSKDVRALHNVNIRIQKGEFVFITGQSGSGKSTLIKLMLKEILASKGKIFVAGKDVGKLRGHRTSMYRRSIGVVFQNYRLLKTMTVAENIEFALRVVGVPDWKIDRQVAKMLSLVGLEDKYKAYPSELSGGQQQRVAIARALANNPVILLADEPTGNLDPKASQEIMKLLDDINKRGTTVIVVTHNAEVVDKMRKRVITLHEGRVVSDEERGVYHNAEI